MSIGLELRAAVRSLARSPAYLVTALLSLALGIGAGAAAFGVVDAVRLRTLPFPHADRLVILAEVPAAATECRGLCEVSYETYANLLRVHPPRSLDAVAAYTSGGKSFAKGGDPVLLTGGIASPNLFDLLEVRPQLGRGLLAEDDRLGVPLVVLLSHAFWTTQLGGDRRVIGQTIKLSDSHYTVIGVMPPGFEHEVRSQFWLPVVPTLDPSTRPSIRSVTAIGRLAPGRTLAQLNAELKTLDPAELAASRPKQSEPARLFAMPLRERYVGSTQSHDLIFAAIVGCVLLIACANLANLSLVRALGQERELALRTALGANRVRLTGALLLRHALIIVPATGLGLLVAGWLLGVLRSLTALQSLRPPGMDYTLDLKAIGFAGGLAILIGGFLSLVSSRAIARSDPQRVLQDGAPTAGGGRRGSRLQQAFVVIQVACAVALLTAAGLLTKTSFRLARVDLGFSAAEVIQGTPSFPHPWRVKEKYLPVTREIVRGLQQLPGVASVAIRAEVPLPGDTLVRRALSIGPGYFKTLGVTLLQGREFTEQDLETAAPVAIVNQWAARHWWPGGEPLGRSLRVDTAPGHPTTLTIVGVVRDNHAADRSFLVSAPGPELYRPYEQAPSAFPGFYVRAAQPTGALLKQIRVTLAQLVPDRPLFASRLADDVARQLDRIRLNALQILSFAVIGLALALLGIAGVLGYSVRRRFRELGIRGALGASGGRIERLVLWDAVRLALLGIALGLPLAMWSSRLIDGMLYGTSRTDAAVYGAVTLTVALVALVAAYLPARRAARIDPVVALRAP